MSIVDLLENNKDRVTVSFEFIPQTKGLTKQKLLDSIAPLMEVKPLFVDVTTHRNAIEIIPTPSGRVIYEHHKHVSTLPICQTIMDKFDVEVMPHILCGSFSKEDTEDFMLDAKYLGIDNLFAVRGDKLSIEKRFTPRPDGNVHASDLITQISEFCNGKLLDGFVEDKSYNFCIGACAYPEKHLESPNFEEDIIGTLARFNAGAEFFITQMFFDNSDFYSMINRYSNVGISAKFIPGLKVLSTESQYRTLSSIFGISIPHQISIKASKSTWIEAGVEHCINQCKDLIANGHKHLHFFTMNSSLVLKVIKEIL